jgi:hypothetical protein
LLPRTRARLLRPSRILKNPILLRLLKKVQMQGGARRAE